MQKLIMSNFLLAIVFCFLAFPSESLAKSFSDVKMNTEMGRAVDDLSNRGIISGYANGTFRPNNDVTRAQAAKIVAGAVKMESHISKYPELVWEYPEYYTPQPFRDLAVSSAYFEPVSALGDWGAMNGYDDNTFKPNNKLTRAQIAKVLMRAYAIPNQDEASYTSTGKKFKDVNSESESYSFIRKINELGIMQETSKGYFSPNKRVTRGELALYIYRLDQHFAKQYKQASNGQSLNAPGSLVAHLYEGESVMAQQIYYEAPNHTIRMRINETFTFGEDEGTHCSSYTGYSLCSGYVWESGEIYGIFIQGNGYSVSDLEELVGEYIEIEVYEDGPSPYSFYFEYEGVTYFGETAGPSHSEEVQYLGVSVR